MKKTRYVKPVAEVLFFALEEIRMLDLVSSNNGEDDDYGNGDNNGDRS